MAVFEKLKELILDPGSQFAEKTATVGGGAGFVISHAIESDPTWLTQGVPAAISLVGYVCLLANVRHNQRINPLTPGQQG